MIKVEGNFWVGNYPFPYWFNNVLRPKRRDLFPHGMSLSGFEELAAEYKSLTGKPYTNLNEFIGHIIIIYNETGGQMRPLDETGGLEYLFEPGTHKASYNTLPGNTPCGEELQNRGYALRSLRKWNATTFPSDAPEEEKELAREHCGFSKYRGRGLNQLTGEANYKRYASPVTGDVTKMTSTELSEAFKKPSVYTRVFYSFITGSATGRAALAELEKGNFAPYARLVAGNNSHYIELFVRRCEAVQKGLKKEHLSRSEFFLKHQKVIQKAAIITGVSLVGLGIGNWLFKKLSKKEKERKSKGGKKKG